LRSIRPSGVAVVDTSGMLSRKRARRNRGARAGATNPASPPAANTSAPEPEPATPTSPPAGSSSSGRPSPTTGQPRRTWRQAWPLSLIRAAHPKQALLTAAALAAAGGLVGRPSRELGLIFATVVVGQAIVGWHNDLVDRTRDAANETPRKPVAQGFVEPGTVWFTIACAALLVVPLSIANGVTAGIAYLVALVVSLMGNVTFRKGWLSWLTWAVSFALYPAFLSYGGWGGATLGDPPEISITVLAGLLGVCVHFLRALPGLVADNRDGFRHLPLRVALRTGAPRLLWITIVLTALVVAALLVTGSRVGLAQ
jgi:4-hydroxybenzoate polyprenyltransferase